MSLTSWNILLALVLPRMLRQGYSWWTEKNPEKLPARVKSILEIYGVLML
jgi:hypothetical protein